MTLTLGRRAAESFSSRCSVLKPVEMREKDSVRLQTSLDPLKEYLAEDAVSEGRVDTAAVPALIEALDDNDAEVRSQAVTTLGEMGKKNSRILSEKSPVPALFERLDDQDEAVREDTVDALTQINKADASLFTEDETIASLVELLDAADDEARSLAAESVEGLVTFSPAVFDEEETVATIRRVADDAPDESRAAAVYALTGIAVSGDDDSGTDAFKRVAEALGDDSPVVREKAAMSVDRFGSAEPQHLHGTQAVRKLVEALDDEDDVREAATSALNRVGNNDADLLADEDVVCGFVEHLSTERDAVNEAASRFLEAYPKNAPEAVAEDAVVEKLLEAAEDGTRRGRRMAFYLLAEASVVRSGEDGLIDETVEALHDTDEDIRKATAWTVAEVGEKDATLISGTTAVEDLVALLDDEAPQVRAEAARALGKLCAASVSEEDEPVRALAETAEDDESKVRDASARALSKVADRRPEAVVAADACDVLGRSLMDDDVNVRLWSFKALVSVGKTNPDAVEGTGFVTAALAEAADAESPNRQSVLNALSEVARKKPELLDHPAVVPEMERIMMDDTNSSHVRQNAAVILSSLVAAEMGNVAPSEIGETLASPVKKAFSQDELHADVSVEDAEIASGALSAVASEHPEAVEETGFVRAVVDALERDGQKEREFITKIVAHLAEKSPELLEGTDVGPRLVSLLEEDLQKAAHRETAKAVGALGENAPHLFGDSEPVPVLLDGVGSDVRMVSSASLRAIRRTATGAPERFRDTDVAEILVELLDDDNLLTRRHAISTIAELVESEPEAVEDVNVDAVRRLQDDRDDSIRSTAHEVLEKMEEG